jgi:hypothetical protein
MGLGKLRGPERDEERWEWKRLQKEELHDLYPSPGVARMVQLKIMTWTDHVARVGEGRGVQKVLMEELEGKRKHGTPKCSW